LNDPEKGYFIKKTKDMTMKIYKIAATAVAVALLGAAAFAHSGATGVVKQRMEGMGAMGKAVKMVAPMMRGEIAYDAEVVRGVAKVIRMHAGETLTALFPEGSAGMPSEAKVSIWSDWERFAEMAAQLEVYAEGLGMAAGNGMRPEDMTAGDDMMAGDMMGGDMMGGGEPMMGIEALADMPVDAVFDMVSQTCAACHTAFRADSM